MRELEAIIIWFVYLNESSPKGMVKTISNTTRDHTEYTLNILQKRELTSMPIMKPNTILNTILLAPTKNMDASTSLVMPYDIMVDAKEQKQEGEIYDECG